MGARCHQEGFGHSNQWPLRVLGQQVPGKIIRDGSKKLYQTCDLGKPHSPSKSHIHTSKTDVLDCAVPTSLKQMQNRPECCPAVPRLSECTRPNLNVAEEPGLPRTGQVLLPVG